MGVGQIGRSRLVVAVPCAKGEAKPVAPSPRLRSLAYAVSLLVIVIACVTAASVPALRAARLDPIATLRND
jgi:hypothetical protein